MFLCITYAYFIPSAKVLWACINIAVKIETTDAEGRIRTKNSGDNLCYANHLVIMP